MKEVFEPIFGALVQIFGKGFVSALPSGFVNFCLLAAVVYFFVRGVLGVVRKFVQDASESEARGLPPDSTIRPENGGQKHEPLARRKPSKYDPTAYAKIWSDDRK